MIEQHSIGRDLGIFGEPRVNALELNLALERASPEERWASQICAEYHYKLQQRPAEESNRTARVQVQKP